MKTEEYAMRVLVFAPHADDEVLGCGGTMARYVNEGAEAYVCIVTSGKKPIFDDTAAVQNGWPHIHYLEVVESHKVLGIKKTFFLEFPAAALENVPRYQLNQRIQEVMDKVQPDVVFIPHFGDMQKDHALTAEAVMVSVRPKGKHTVQQVYSYETLSETEWNIPHAKNAFIPTVFIGISKYIDKKLEAMSCYKSQLGKFPNPRSLEAIEALAKYRGSTSGGKYSEAFMLIREYRD